jgi:Arrestin (or S-antigen), N-terminal domain
LSLNVGTHEYPFEFVVGPNLPTSIETLFSYIRYWLKAVIDYGGLTRDEKIKIGFSVNKLNDINVLDNIFQVTFKFLFLCPVFRAVESSGYK